MNKLFLIPVGMLATALLSCETDQSVITPNMNTLQQQEANTSQETASSNEEDRKLLKSELPVNIQTYISTQYPTAQYIYAETEEKNGVVYEYEVVLLDAGQVKEITFSSTGVFKKVSLKNKSSETYLTAETIANGPIGQDLTERFPNYVFIYAKQKTEKEYANTLVTEVTIRYAQSEIELLYSSENQLLEIDVEGNEIETYFTSLNTLPTVIQNYIQANFVGATFVKAESEEINGAVISYEVKIRTTTEQVSLLFDENGQLLSQRQKKEQASSKDNSTYISFSALPTSIQSHLATTYTGYVFQKAEIERRNGQITYYEVDIRFNGREWEIKYSATGQFISAKQD